MTTYSTLPFTKTETGNKKPVFAHYMSSLPASLKSYVIRNYMSPHGEKDKWLACGGFTRDAMDADTIAGEISQMLLAGINGPIIDLLSTSGNNWTYALQVYDECVKQGGKVIPCPDMTNDRTAQTWATSLKLLFAKTSSYKIGETFVVAPFLAEKKPGSYYKEVERLTGKKISWIPQFLNVNHPTNGVASWTSQNYKPYALSHWGERSPNTVNVSSLVKISDDLGIKWAQPIAVQDVRPRSLVYTESGNTETLRRCFEVAELSNADILFLDTWNDLAEGTQFMPSLKHQDAFLVYTAWLMSKFRHESPKIDLDWMMITHRQHDLALKSFPDQAQIAVPRPGTLTPRNTLEVVTLLTEPAKLAINGVYSTTLEDGEDWHVVAMPSFKNVAPVATLSRDIMNVVGYLTSDAPNVQDMQYLAATSSWS